MQRNVKCLFLHGRIIHNVYFLPGTFLKFNCMKQGKDIYIYIHNLKKKKAHEINLGVPGQQEREGQARCYLAPRPSDFLLLRLLVGGLGSLAWWWVAP